MVTYDKAVASKLFNNFKEKNNFFFIGNIGALQYPMVFIKTMKLLSKNNKVHFLFIGDGIMLSKLKFKVAELNLSNVDF